MAAILMIYLFRKKRIMTIEEILTQLPNSWDSLKFKDYLSISNENLIIEGDEFAQLDNSVTITATITGLPKEELESLSMLHVLAINEQLKFLNTLPEYNDKPTLKLWKPLDAITYDDYVFFINNEKNIDLLEFALRFQTGKYKLGKEQIEQLSALDILSGFFLFRKQLKKSLKTSIKLEKRKLLILKLKNLIHFKKFSKNNVTT